MNKRPTNAKPTRFKMVNWNLGNGQGVRPESLRPVAREQRDNGVSIFGLNEFSPGARKVWRELGYVIFSFGSNAVAYDPEVWERRRGPKTKPGRLLTPITWKRPGGAKVRGSMTKGLLVHRETGYELRVGAIHTPAGVQHRGPSKDPADRQRLRQLLGMMTGLGRLVTRWMPAPKTASEGDLDKSADAVAVAADDNSHEAAAPAEWKPYTGYQVNHLRQLQPPKPTHAGGRGIDPIYIRGLVVIDQWVVPNPSDHHLHGAELEFKNPPKRPRDHGTLRPLGGDR